MEKNLKTGIIIAFIRETKHLKLKEMTGGDFSESQLAKFEKGETEITVGKLFTVLENSNVYLDEFQNLYNEYEQSDEYNYRHELAVAAKKYQSNKGNSKFLGRKMPTET